MRSVLSIERKRFWMFSGIGYTALAVVISLLFFTGTVFAAFPLTGIGGFVIAADKITGTGFKLYPQIGETSEKSVWPQAGVDLATAEIENLNLSKELDVSKELGSYGIYKVIVEITASPEVNGNNLKLSISGLQADMVEFNNLNVKESKSDSALNKIGMTAPGITLIKPELNTHSLLAQSISLPSMKLKIKAFDDQGNLIGGDF